MYSPSFPTCDILCQGIEGSYYLGLPEISEALNPEKDDVGLQVQGLEWTLTFTHTPRILSLAPKTLTTVSPLLPKD